MVDMIILLSLLSAVGAVTLNGSADYAIPGRQFNLTCDVPEEATSVSIYRRPLMTNSPWEMKVTSGQCFITVASTAVLCTPDVCSCQPVNLNYGNVFRLVINPNLPDQQSLWFCRRQNANLPNEFEDSPDYALQVLEQVSSIVLQNPPSTVTEHQTILLVCVTSPCRPPASVTWSVGGVDYILSSTSVQETSLSFITISRLTLTLTRAMSGQTVVCSANNMDIVVSNTQPPTLDVQYGPDTSMSLSPAVTSHTGNEGDTLPDITCTADCRPGCTYVWTRPDNTNFVASAVLSLGQLDRSEHGTYHCTAQNSVGTSNTTYSLAVRYSPSTPIVIQLSTNYWLGGGEYRVLLCSYSEGFPSPASIDWFRDGISAGVYTPAFILGPLRQADNGTIYSCRIRNTFADIKMVNLTSSTYILNVACGGVSNRFQAEQHILPN